jgi:hypothetical protein
MTKTRLNVYLERDHSQRVDELAAMKRLSRSSIVAAALAAFLSPEGGERREVATARRLDKLGRQFERLERDQTILIETVALFVRYYLSVTTPIPEEHQDAARAQGRGDSSSSSSNSVGTCSAAGVSSGTCTRKLRRGRPT